MFHEENGKLKEELSQKNSLISENDFLKKEIEELKEKNYLLNNQIESS